MDAHVSTRRARRGAERVRVPEPGRRGEEGRGRRRTPGEMVAAVVHRLPRLRFLRLRLRTWLVLLVLLAVAGVAGWLWLRDSSLVAVERVEISGVSGQGAPQVEQALERAARTMTTLNVDEDALRKAVAIYPQVKDVRVTADPPHRLAIAVVQRHPVAALESSGRRTPVAADGTLLGQHASADGLPVVPIAALPAGGRLTDGRAAALLKVAAGAPEATRPYVDRLEVAEQGIQARLRNGPVVIFGTAERARAKWIAMGRVLGDEGSAGATYLDVRLPERPVAGGFDGQATPSSGG
jgi:cell division protein FtsQ